MNGDLLNVSGWITELRCSAKESKSWISYLDIDQSAHRMCVCVDGGYFNIMQIITIIAMNEKVTGWLECGGIV